MSDMVQPPSVIPAKRRPVPATGAGIHSMQVFAGGEVSMVFVQWIPTCAGMTRLFVHCPSLSTSSC